MLEPSTRRASGQRLLAALYLAASMGAAAVLLVPGQGEMGTSLPFYGAWIVLYALTAWAWLRRRLRVAPAVLALFVLAGWALLSAGWSARPDATAQYGLALVANVVFVAWLRSRFELASALRLILATLLVLVVASLVLYVAGVEVVRYVDVHQRSTLVGTEPLRGLFNHKITAGTYTVLGGVIAWYLTGGLVRAVVLVTLAVFVTLTGSTGALALVAFAAAAIAFLGVARRLRWGAGVVVAFTLAGALVGATMLVTAAPPILEAVGRDGSLTGRTDLWAWGGAVAMERPLLGWGFFGYAGSERALEDAAQIPRFANYALPHFHNAYLQGFVDLGLVGALAPAALVLVALFAHARRGLRSGDRGSLAAVALLIVALGAGMGMHAFVQYNHFLTLSVFTAFAYVRTG